MRNLDRGTVLVAEMAGLSMAMAAVCFLPAPTALAQNAKQVEPQAERPREALNKEFNQIVLGQEEAQNPDATRIQLEGILARKLAALDGVYHLSEAQKQRLTLAGRGDISRLLDRIDSARKTYSSSRRVQRVGNNMVITFSLNPEVAALRAAMESGPFGEDSLFAKMQKTVLREEQIEKEGRLRQLASLSTKRIALDNVTELHSAVRYHLDVYQIRWRNSHELGLLAFDKALEIRSADDFRILRTVGQRHKGIGFDFNHTGDKVAFGDNSQQDFVINLATGKEIALATGNPQPSVTFSPDGKLLATGGYGKRVSLWSAESGERIADLDTGPKAGGLTAVFSPDGKVLAVGNRNSSARLFDVATRQLLHNLPSAMSQGLKFDPSGQRLAITHVDGSLSVWDVGTGELVRNNHGIAQELYSVDWSPDGTLIATSGRRAPVTLWRASDLKVLKEIECPDWVICVGFSPDGTRLVYAGGSSTPGGDRFVEVLAVP
jgi:Eukaryotic translation initiation factor eIF2A/WD domain, G-beta repeat